MNILYLSLKFWLILRISPKAKSMASVRRKSHASRLVMFEPSKERSNTYVALTHRPDGLGQHIGVWFQVYGSQQLYGTKRISSGE